MGFVVDARGSGSDKITKELTFPVADGGEPVSMTIELRKPNLNERLADERWAMNSWDNVTPLSEAAAQRFITRLDLVIGWSGVSVKKVKDGEEVEEEVPFSRAMLEAAVAQSPEFRAALSEAISPLF